MNSKPDNVTQSLTPGHNPGIRASGVTSLGSHDPVSGKTMQILSKPWIEEEDRPQAITEADAAELQLAALDGAASAEVATAQPAATIGAVDAPAAAAGAGAATLSPVAIGAGVLGVVAVAAAAGGSSGGGSSPAPQAPIASKPPTADKPSVTTDKPAASTDKPAAEKPENPGDKTEDQVKPTAESVPSRGTLDAPLVAESGNTRLNAASFEQAGPSGQKPAFIQIQSIQEKIDGGTRGAQVVRFGDDAPKTKDANPEAHLQGKLTAYEIIRADQPITREEAIKMAEKLGGKLLEVNTDKEGNWLAANFFGALGEYSGDQGNEHAAHEMQANGAWIGSHHAKDNTDAAIRGGGMLTDGIKFFDHSADTLRYFVVEYGDYQAPLLLIKDGQSTPVVAGQIIAADDVKHLVWNSDNNKGGAITFQAVTTSNPETAQPLANTEARTLTINESPTVVANVPPVEAPANHVDHSSTNDAPQGGQPAADSTQPAAQEKPAVEKPQDVEVPSAVRPVYSNDPVPVNVGLDKQHALASNLFVGSDAAKMPSAVKITELVETADTKPAESALSVVRPNAEAVSLSVNSTIQQADFDYVRWDSAQNTGGSFKFQALTAAGQPIQDATAQVLLHEKQQTLPQYPGQQPMLTVTHQGDLKLASSIFAGTDESQAPDYILITQVLGGNKRSLDKSLILNGANDKKTPVQSGEFIARADFDKLSWDADHSNGGSFAFEAYDADKQRIHGAVRQTVTVYEQPASPTYNNQQHSQEGKHNQPVLFDKSVFTGTGNPPPYIKITTITPTGNGNKDEALVVFKANGVLETAVKEGTIIAFADYAYLRWEGDKQNGGTFKFQALDHHEKPLEGVAEQTVTVTEAQAPVTSSGASGSTGVQGAQDTSGASQGEKLGRTGNAGSNNETEEEAQKLQSDDANAASPGASPKPGSESSGKPAPEPGKPLEDQGQTDPKPTVQGTNNASTTPGDASGQPTTDQNGQQGPGSQQGPAGQQEPAGQQGPGSPQGPAGQQEPAGQQGPGGPQGPAGQQEPAGQQGPGGAQGPAGQQEPDGLQGPGGPQGPAGQQEPAGQQGPGGPQGPAGQQEPGTAVSPGGSDSSGSAPGSTDASTGGEKAASGGGASGSTGTGSTGTGTEGASGEDEEKSEKVEKSSFFRTKSLSFDELLGGDAGVEQGGRSYEPVAVSHDLLNKPVADELLFTNGSIF